MRARDRRRGPPPNEGAALESREAENLMAAGARKEAPLSRGVAPPRPPPERKRSPGKGSNFNNSGSARHKAPARHRQPSLKRLRVARAFLAPSRRARR